MTDQPAPGLSVEEIKARFIEISDKSMAYQADNGGNPARAIQAHSDELHARITEHVRTVLEAERDGWFRDGSEEGILLGKAMADATLTEQLDKAVEGLKKIERASEVWADTAVNKTESLCRPETTKHVARSTLAAIEGESHDG